MYGLEDDVWQKWKFRRRNTVIAFLIMGVSIGIDFLVVLNTLFLYLRDVVKAELPEVWYGVIYASFFVSSTLFGITLGRWVDRTRKIRVYVNVTILVQLAGCFFYIIPRHPLWLMVGRTLSGISDSLAALAAGEVFRIFDKEDQTRVMALLSSVYAVGAMIGPPALAYLSADIDVTLGPIKINHLNFIGVFMMAFLLMQLVLVNLLVHNCSLQFDLKEHLKNDIDETNQPQSTDVIHTKDESSLLVEAASVSSQPVSVRTVLKALFSNKGPVLVFTSTLVIMYGLMTVTTLFPLLVTVLLQWDVKHLSIIYAASGAFELVYLFLLARFVKNNVSNYYLLLTNVTSQIVNVCVIVSLKFLPRDYLRDLVLVIVCVVTMVLGYSFDDISIKVLFAHMVPSQVQSFSEGLRSGVSRTSVVVASLTVAVVMPWCHVWAVAMLVVYIILLGIFLVVRTQIMDPIEVHFNGDVHITNA